MIRDDTVLPVQHAAGQNLVRQVWVLRLSLYLLQHEPSSLPCLC